MSDNVERIEPVEKIGGRSITTFIVRVGARRSVERAAIVNGFYPVLAELSDAGDYDLTDEQIDEVFRGQSFDVLMYSIALAFPQYDFDVSQVAA